MPTRHNITAGWVLSISIKKQEWKHESASLPNQITSSCYDIKLFTCVGIVRNVKFFSVKKTKYSVVFVEKSSCVKMCGQTAQSKLCKRLASKTYILQFYKQAMYILTSRYRESGIPNVFKQNTCLETR